VITLLSVYPPILLRRLMRSPCCLYICVSSLLTFVSFYVFVALPFDCPKCVAYILEMTPCLESSTSMRLDSQVHLVLSDES
jgi:hypothetical protein